jgi:predicted nucleotidyltransferase
MSSSVEKLTKRGLINPPNDVKSNTMYETIVGSIAYGVADDLSDFDVNGFYIPAAHKLFPTMRGHLLGFDADPKAPKAFQQHHIDDQEGRRTWDLNIYSIPIYFRLCLENNPNMVDTLYTPRDCVLHSTPIAEMVREKRDLFLHKRCWPKYKGYAYQQLHKMKGKQPEEGSKRHKLRERYGYDVKFAYHLVRLLYEAEMIVNEGTIDIRRHREHLKAIRRGDVSQADVEAWAANKEEHLERAFEETSLRAEPARAEIKQLLINCLEHHYGKLSELTVIKTATSDAEVTLDKIRELLDIPTIRYTL